MQDKTIPAHLMRDKYWKSVLHLFMNHYKLYGVFTTRYFDLERETIDTTALKRASRGWSPSEKFMLNLALHLFNDSNRLPNGLSEMASLDSGNTKLVIEAIAIRYGG